MGHIIHTQFFGQLFGNLIAQLCLVVTVGEQVKGLGRAKPEEVGLLVQFNLVRFLGKPPGGIPPAADALCTAVIEGAAVFSE